jgi:hypothetical protein
VNVRPLLFSMVLPLVPVSAYQAVEFQTGALRGAGAPEVDYGTGLYKYDGFRIGAFSSPKSQGVTASYVSMSKVWIFDIGQREKSLDYGFLVSNGAYLPWTRNFAFAEPIGMRLGARSKIVGTDTAYYQQAADKVAVGRLFITPVPWLFISTGAAKMAPEDSATPIVSHWALKLGSQDAEGFQAGGELVGERNALAYFRYADDVLIRALAFTRPDPMALASGIFNAPRGLALQFMSENWFSQLFVTDGYFGTMRYEQGIFAAIVQAEDNNELVGISLRNNPKGAHLRAGATAARDGSAQTLLGLGYADLVFVGVGHYEAKSPQPIEPLIFPSAWYSSILLQSSAMSVRDSGFKLMTLVNTESIRGFTAVTYSEDRRGRQKFGFFFRLGGYVSF